MDGSLIEKQSDTFSGSKFSNPNRTLDGGLRAVVRLNRLDTLWFNTGTVCNLSCANCYIESSPTNDRLSFLTATEVARTLDELQANWQAEEVGFTGGEPFINPEILEILDDSLARGYQVLILTNAMRPMMKISEELLSLRRRYGKHLRLRVSVDHYDPEIHELERGEHSWRRVMDGLLWLAANHFNISIAGRTFSHEEEADLRQGYANLFKMYGIPIDVEDPAQLVLFPEMDETLDVPEITSACWDILKVSPDAMMCATSRMVVKHKGDQNLSVMPCTLLPYDKRFKMGSTIAESKAAVALNHPHCARFCVLGGGSCSVA